MQCHTQASLPDSNLIPQTRLVLFSFRRRNEKQFDVVTVSQTNDEVRFGRQQKQLALYSRQAHVVVHDRPVSGRQCAVPHSCGIQVPEI